MDIAKDNKVLARYLKDWQLGRRTGYWILPTRQVEAIQPTTTDITHNH